MAAFQSVHTEPEEARRAHVPGLQPSHAPPDATQHPALTPGSNCLAGTGGSRTCSSVMLQSDVVSMAQLYSRQCAGNVSSANGRRGTCAAGWQPRRRACPDGQILLIHPADRQKLSTAPARASRHGRLWPAPQMRHPDPGAAPETKRAAAAACAPAGRGRGRAAGVQVRRLRSTTSRAGMASRMRRCRRCSCRGDGTSCPWRANLAACTCNAHVLVYTTPPTPQKRTAASGGSRRSNCIFEAFTSSPSLPAAKVDGAWA